MFMRKAVSVILALMILLQILPAYGWVAGAESDDETKNVDLHSYRWEIKENTLVSVTTGGNKENSINRTSGSIANGVLKNARYTLETTVQLYHDVPWIIEWRSTGSWSGMLLSSTNQSPSANLTYLFRDPGSKIFAFGEYTGSWNNYGMALDFDVTVSHVFRLENRIDLDGSNRVYLLLDGQQVDAMDRYYVSASYQNKTVDWANGKNLVFSNIGTSSHPVNGMRLDYLQIWEGGHDHIYGATVTPPTDTERGYTTYTCTECGYSYVGDYVDPDCNHVWSEWEESIAPTCSKEGQDTRVCTVCGCEQQRDTRITGDPERILVSDPFQQKDLSGKNMLLIGDSITYGVGTTKTYGAYLSESLGVRVTNKGVSGSGYCSGGKMTTNATLTEDNIRNADIITIMLGVNDWAWATKEYYGLGEFQSEDTSTFYGALHSWCRNILRLKAIPGFEEKVFIVITPLITSWNNSVGQRDWNQDKQNVHGHVFRQYCVAIMEVCAYYDIPVFDANMFSGIYYRGAEDTNVGETGGDGVHVNENGHALLAEALEEFLLEGYSYENRKVAQGGHSYEDHVCRECRLPYVCHHVYDEIVIQPTCTAGGYTVYTCVSCGETHQESGAPATGHSDGDIDRNNLCDSCGAYLAPAALLSRSVSLYGNIGVNFYMSLAPEVVEDEDAYMLFTRQEEEPLRVYVKDSTLVEVRGETVYCFTYAVSAKEMTDTIEAQLFYGENKTEMHTYSVKTYCDNFLHKLPKDSSLRKLLGAMLRYGGAAQRQFDYHLERLADEGLEEIDYTDLQISGFESNENQGTERVTLAGATLLLKSETTLRYFFKVQPGTEGFRVTHEGKELAVTLRNGLYYVDVENISAPDLDEIFVVTIDDGTNTADVAFSPMSYVASVRENAQGVHNEILRDLVSALYLYNQAANEYFA